MFCTGPLRIFLLSYHVSLRTACDMVRQDAILGSVRKAHRALVRLGVPHPTIAVAGLNPHSGDSGTMGWEEGREVEPAVAAARREGIDCRGPVPGAGIGDQPGRGHPGSGPIHPATGRQATGA